MTELDMKSQT